LGGVIWGYDLQIALISRRLVGQIPSGSTVHYYKIE